MIPGCYKPDPPSETPGGGIMEPLGKAKKLYIAFHHIFMIGFFSFEELYQQD